jgi:hypothetical protein
MTKATIEIDTYVSLEYAGITHVTYLGDHDTPSVEDTVTWDVLIDEAYDAMCVPSGPIVYDTGHDGADELLCLADQMRCAADLLEERVRASKILLRPVWVEDGCPSNSDDYCVSYNDYLTYVIENT